MIKLLTTPAKLSNGQVTNLVYAKREENPIEFDAKMAFLQSIGFFDNKPLDRFIKKATTEAVTGLQSFLADRSGNSYKSSMHRSFNDSNTSNKTKDPFESLL